MKKARSSCRKLAAFDVRWSVPAIDKILINYRKYLLFGAEINSIFNNGR